MKRGKFVIFGNASWDSAGMGGNSSQQYARTLMRQGWQVAFRDPQGPWHLSEVDPSDPENTIVMCDFPYSQEALDLFLRFKQAGCRTVVRICDHWKTLNLEAPYDAKLEIEFVKAADRVFALNPLNVERYAELRPDIELLRNGVDLLHFQHADIVQVPEIPKGRRNLGVVASFWFRDWVNLEPVLAYARKHPEDKIHFIGYAERVLNVDSLPENVILHGPKHWSETVAYLKQFDVGLIPYEPELTQTINPSKAMDYLAAGIPVVSCLNPTLLDYPNIFFYEDNDSFEDAIELAMSHPRQTPELNMFLRENTWEKKIEIILDRLSLIPTEVS